MATITRELTPPLRGQSPYVRFYLTGLDLENDLLDLKFRQNQKYPQIWKLIYLRYNAAMSAVVANRVIIVNHRSSWEGLAETNLITFNSETIAASQTAYVQMSGVGVLTGGNLGAGGNINDHFQLPGEGLTLIGPDDFLRFTSSNAQTGDLGFIYAALKYMNYELDIPTGFEKWHQQQ